MVKSTTRLSPVTGSVRQARDKCLCTRGMTSTLVGRKERAPREERGPLPHQCLLSRSRTRKPSWPLGHLWEEWVHEPGPHLELASCAGLARFCMFVSQPSAQL